jgi:transcription antitermination factor NusG
VKPRNEKIAAAGLRANGLEEFAATYTELRKWSDRVKKVEVRLFPGYVFCRFVPEQRTTVLKTPGVLSVVGFGGVPTAVPEEEIAALRLVVESGLPARPCPYLEAGNR